MPTKFQSLDSCFWNMDTDTTKQVIGCLCLLDRAPSLDEAKAVVAEVVATSPRLRDRVTKGGKLRWERSSTFDLDHHVTEEVFGLRNTAATLDEAVERVFLRPLDEARPPWRFTLFANRRDENTPDAPRAAFLFSGHHALSDGLGGLAFIERLCRGTKLAHATPTFSKHQANSTRPPIFKTAAQIFGLMFRQATTSTSPLVGENTSLRKFTASTLSLDELLLQKSKLGVTLNDLLLGLLSRALTQFHTVRGHRAEDLTAIVPVSIRRNANEIQLGNQLIPVSLKLPLTVTDLIEQIRAVRARVNEMKENGSAVAYRALVELIGRLPDSVQKRLCERQARQTHFICTNVPASREAQSFCGATILGKYGLPALLHGHGVGFSFITYTNKLCVSLITDPNVIDDPGELLTLFREAKAELAQRLGIGGQEPVLDHQPTSAYH